MRFSIEVVSSLYCVIVIAFAPMPQLGKYQFFPDSMNPSTTASRTNPSSLHLVTRV